jgi:hypothetical protein
LVDGCVFVRKDGRAATSRRITGGLNGVCALRSNMSVSDINSFTKEGLTISAVDTSMSMCHPQRRDTSSLGPRKQIHVDQSVAPLPLVPLLHDCAYCHGTVSTSSLSKSAGEHPPQAGDGNFGNGLQMKVPDARTTILPDFT